MPPREQLLLPVLAAALVATVAAGAHLRADAPRRRAPETRPLPARPEPVDHAAFLVGPFADGPAVTRACLECHPRAAEEVMRTGHWTWAGQEALVPGQPAPLAVGKRNLLNNFCIAVAGNWPRCTSCHAGYGWRDEGFLASAGPERVDCLVCHDRSGQYLKAPAGAGEPAPEVDLLASARSVGRPTRSNCGACHFAGGGGDAVKHGDLDGTMHQPPARIDVHMGAHDLACVDCHRTHEHRIGGRLLPIEPAPETRIACTDCHAAAPHDSERLNAHLAAVSCQACHIPRVALDAATKTSWDWSQAGRDPAAVAAEDPAVAADPHLYSQAKGRFTFARGLVPSYAWYDGASERYLPGQEVRLEGTVALTAPRGGVDDARARIWPFKVHRGRQPVDLQRRTLLYVKTWGPGGYWTTFDWEGALRLGAEASGLPYSGQHGWVETSMHWPLNHMVQAAGGALQCVDCHGPEGRLDWRALGYPGDPATHGGRRRLGLVREGRAR